MAKGPKRSINISPAVYEKVKLLEEITNMVNQGKIENILCVASSKGTDNLSPEVFVFSSAMSLWELHAMTGYLMSDNTIMQLTGDLPLDDEE